MIDEIILSKEAEKELSRRDFFYFCHLMAPDFYKEDREYLVNLCNEMQSFYNSTDEKVMIINLPPRHGKSRTAGMFTQWMIGKNKNNKIMTGSYNETLSTMFSKNVRNAIQEKKVDNDIFVYNDIFPDIKIKKGDGSMNLWSVEGGYNNYLATSPTGTATGFGATILLIDDLIKNSEEAFNENTLEQHWSWFTNTMLSRLEEGGKIIIIMTRWSSRDLAGRALKHYKNKKVRLVIMKAYDEKNNKMLCSEVLSYESYQDKIGAMGEEIASANYQQVPIDLKGALYKTFKTYINLPKDENGNSLAVRRFAYVDTADTGEDYLSSIIVDEFNNEAYIVDVYFTKEPMEITEEELAFRLATFGVNEAFIESNNGGRGFARAVEKELRAKYRGSQCVISWFSQNKNKKARILSNSSWVQQHIYYPVNWRDKFPEFYNHMVSYQKEGKNKHDDGADSITGISEKISEADAILFD